MGSLALACKEHSLICHVAVVHERSALLVRYRDPSGYDGQTGWFNPNDALRHAEDPRVAARRILKEQTGIEKVSLKLVEVESFIGNDGSWHLVFDYLASPVSMTVTKGEGVMQASWFDIDKLPPANEFSHEGWGRGLLLRLAQIPA